MKRSRAAGFSIIEAIIVLIVIAGVSLGGWLVWRHRQHQQKKPTSVVSNSSVQANKQSANQSPVDPYAGWKTATSPMAGFTIKYPSTWLYNLTLGKDGAEHITIDSSHMHLMIDSYSDAPDNKCPNCLQTLNSTNFTASNLGSVALETITYKLDSETSNALILELPNSIYYFPSKTHANTSTTFRGISALNSEQAYQTETASQFEANQDYKTAKQILQSVAY